MREAEYCERVVVHGDRIRSPLRGIGASRTGRRRSVADSICCTALARS
jgi:hypothetical protein